MPHVVERPSEELSKVQEKTFFQVFLMFEKPDGYVSLFVEGVNSGCGIYVQLASIFERLPREVYESICSLADGEKEASMQEYLSLEDASQAVSKASLFAHTSRCVCFLKQQGRFFIKERKVS